MFLLIRNYATDDILDRTLNNCIDSGIKSTNSVDEYINIVTFKNKIKIEYWNVNRYYSWMNSGVIMFPDGNEYQWRTGMPRIRTIRRFRKALSKI